MIQAYDRIQIENLHYQSVINDWQEDKLLTKEQAETALQEFPVELYQPNWFIRIGLFIFTNLVSYFSVGFIGLFLNIFDSENSLGVLSILMSFVFVFFLEYFIKTRKVYHSGIDNALLYSAVGTFVAGIFFLTDKYLVSWQYPLIMFLVSVPAIVRYADALLSIFSFICFYCFLFLLITETDTGKLVIPFVIMLVSGIIYFISQKTKTTAYYLDCQYVIEVLALAFFYLGGNYLIVKEGNAMLTNASDSAEIALAWLFWIFTFLIPVLYLIWGGFQKDRKPIVVGLVAFGFSVFTFRFYHDIMLIEWALTIGGTILILLSIWAIRFLKSPRYNLTSLPMGSTQLQDLEAFIIAQTLKMNQPTQSSKFGGGDFGGGGADGKY